ncbi:FG-GAP repeat domain-containing protein [Streptomyces sp. NPDC048370]|uniref:FG-GAP repeat domain-containing protein n=1 Tax=Streptomyces sp. NPDC048370 TaxID=3365540 RepID=UPI00371A0E97
MTIARRSRALRGALAVTAVAAALATTAGTAFASGDPGAPAASAAAAEQRAQDVPSKAPRAAGTADVPVETPTFSMDGVHKQTHEMYMYFADRQGAFDAPEHLPLDYSNFASSIQVDNDKDGYSDGTWTRYKDGPLWYGWIDEAGDGLYHKKQVGTGWNIYTTVLSPGTLGGAPEADLIGLDKAGVLWGYLAHPDGSLTARFRIGGGWEQYTQLAGQGDLSGDGKADIVARDTSGTLWLYKGTGDYKAPFEPRTRIGGGWNTYDRLLSVGDLDIDGRSDLIARKPNGDLFRYSGTGDAQAVYKAPVKIGYGFQIYDLL